MVKYSSILKVGWLVSMPIAMEPQRQANGNLINILGLCGGQVIGQASIVTAGDKIDSLFTTCCETLKPHKI